MKRILKSRADLVSKRQADWALGEAFSIGSLLMEQVNYYIYWLQLVRGVIPSCNKFYGENIVLVRVANHSVLRSHKHFRFPLCTSS